jgi:hypothetical protein
MPPPVRQLALRPWHVISDDGKILDVVDDIDAQRLRDDGYIVITYPADDEDTES